MNTHSTSQTTTRRLSLAVLALFGAATLAACGSEPQVGAGDPGTSTSASPTPTESPTESPSETSSAPPTDQPPAQAPPRKVLERGTGDVDGDGTPDKIQLLVPKKTPDGEPAQRSWLRVVTAEGSVTKQATSDRLYVGFQSHSSGARVVTDLDGNGTEEVLLSSSGGGDGAMISVWTWHDGTLAHAKVAPDVPEFFRAGPDLAVSAEVTGFQFDLGGFTSWKFLDYPPEAPHELHTWTWTLDGTTMSARREPGTWCMDVDPHTIGACP